MEHETDTGGGLGSSISKHMSQSCYLRPEATSFGDLWFAGLGCKD